jgi:hypothetical protein
VGQGGEGLLAAAVFVAVVAAILVYTQILVASFYVSPQAWVLVAPLAHIGSRETAVIATARAIAAALDEEGAGR